MNHATTSKKDSFLASIFQEAFLKYFFPQMWYSIDHWLFHKPKDRILDLGCGSGLFSISMLKSGCNVTSADPSSQCLANLKRLTSNSRLKPRVIQCAPESLPLPDKFFDSIICINLLEFSESPHSVCKEIHRVLKKNGKAVIATNMPYSPWALRPVMNAVRKSNDLQGPRPLTKREFGKVLQASGLTVDTVKFRARFLPITFFGIKIPWYTASCLTALVIKR